ncbi:PREDICTED: uncharacterized protein LOC108970381 isoform X2 [Bactrocera latifrons]|uniref:uncharacterized protein LOC108970381 isoform X2 n=1 Tax=Bactrocera latifrons TaxID=174628 RepID=UPI0008DD73BD|nr:PREDICTED: uncharacterized protein LOC108970381 isoform X2 [Bactrocera latifrons]
MRSFLVLCLLATAFADELGYNYQPVTHSAEGLSFTPGSLLAHAPVAPLPVASAPAQVAPAPAPVAPAPVNVEYEKEFYTYTAPQEETNDAANIGNIDNSLKKNLRVIFIRAPENKALENAAFNLAKQTTEEKTAIYVLTKQADIGSLAQKLQNIGTQSSAKPEVHFVKYRTPQDAENAQQAIQQQYESLPGSSRHSNGGSAQVLNFASPTPATAAAAPAPAAPSSQYLPANAVPSQLNTV